MAKEHRIDNPLRGLDGLLGPLGPLGPQHHVTCHQPGVPVGKVPGCLDAIAPDDVRLSAAVRFCVLTAARRDETAALEWSQIDLEARTWTIPTRRSKTKRDHRVPLSGQAMAMLDKARSVNVPSDKVFGVSKGRMSDTVTKAGLPGDTEGRAATLHGFRSSFKDWARQHDVDETVSEYCLAHVEGSATVRAYARDDLLELRRPIMKAWREYCMG